MRRIKLLSALLTIAVGLSTAQPVLVSADLKDSSDYLKKIVKETTQEDYEENQFSQGKALENYNQVQMIVENNKKVEKVYSGSYINDDGELVVLMEENCNEQLSEKIESIDDSIQIEYVDYTWDELEKVKGIIAEYMQSDSKEKLNFVKASYVDEIKNCVVVNILDLTDEKIALFKKYIIDDERIEFENFEEEKIYEESFAMHGGRAIYITTNGNIGRGSLGFRAKRTTSNGIQYGFVTAGHVGKSVGLKIYADSSCTKQIGVVRKRKYSGSVDAAFVEVTDSACAIGNKVLYSDSKGKMEGVTLNTDVGDPVTNQTVYKSGSSTYLTSGKVTSTSFDGYVGNTYFTDLAKAAYKSASGDSGGTIYEPFIPMNDPYTTVGIHKASGGVFVKAKNIIESLGITRY
ncbi:MAG: S1 family peptidase [Lachnospiraceae bacterium]|nr:S1 family peptidase [Lachnospiraceae bacterium]